MNLFNNHNHHSPIHQFTIRHRSGSAPRIRSTDPRCPGSAQTGPEESSTTNGTGTVGADAQAAVRSGVGKGEWEWSVLVFFW